MAALAILGLVYGTADAGFAWVPLYVSNGDFSWSGGLSSWSPAAPGLSGTNLLLCWQFGAGSSSYNRMASGARVADPLASGRGQVARLATQNMDGTKRIAGYLASERLGPTIEAKKYKLEVDYTTNNTYIYKQSFGFLYGDTTSYLDVTAPWFEGSNSKWTAPYEVNSGLNPPGMFEDRSGEWHTHTLIWDNTGDYPEGYDATTIYTDKRGIGQQLRIGALVYSRTLTGYLYVDNFRVSRWDIPEPATLALLMGGALPVLLRPKRKLRSKPADGGLALGGLGVVLRRKRAK